MGLGSWPEGAGPALTTPGPDVLCTFGAELAAGASPTELGVPRSTLEVHGAPGPPGRPRDLPCFPQAPRPRATCLVLPARKGSLGMSGAPGRWWERTVPWRGLEASGRMLRQLVPFEDLGQGSTRAGVSSVSKKLLSVLVIRTSSHRHPTDGV